MSNHPGVGLYRDVPASTYHAWDVPSSSRSKILWEDTPAHLHYALAESDAEESEALAFGKAAHTLALEGRAEFDKQFAVGGPVNPATGKCYGHSTLKFKEWAAEKTAAGFTCLTSEMMLAVEGIAAAMQEHAATMSHLRASEGHREISGIFRPYSDLDILVKFRVDALALSFGSIFDLKSCESAGFMAVRSMIEKRGYHRQAVMYLMGCNALGLEVEHFVWAFAEKAAPHLISSYRLGSNTKAAAELQVREILEEWDRCLQTDEWPGYPDETIDIELSPYSLKQTLAGRRGVYGMTDW